MRRRSSSFIGIWVTLVAASLVQAAPVRSLDRTAQRMASPTDHLVQIDGPLTTATLPDGRVLAVWSYRKSGEFDLAFAAREPGGEWGRPTFLGQRDGVDQVEPSLAVDRCGSAYLAFTSRQPAPHVSVVVLLPDAKEWSAPVLVSGTDVASAPALHIVAESLIVAYYAARRVHVVEFALPSSRQNLHGIQDGPDGVDPLGFVPPGSGSGQSGSGNSGGGNGAGHKP